MQTCHDATSPFAELRVTGGTGSITVRPSPFDELRVTGVFDELSVTGVFDGLRVTGVFDGLRVTKMGTRTRCLAGR
jgi:hypothetical protein